VDAGDFATAYLFLMLLAAFLVLALLNGQEHDDDDPDYWL
jgi:hypothetical protein